jgi:hypothetical protein
MLKKVCWFQKSMKIFLASNFVQEPPSYEFHSARPKFLPNFLPAVPPLPGVKPFPNGKKVSLTSIFSSEHQ